jgi:hypothetical protein
MPAARRTTKKKAPAKKRAATKKRTPAKRKSPAKAKANGSAKKSRKDSGPLELVVKDEAVKFQLEAAELLFDREDKRLLADLQPKVDALVSRTKRNDQKWKKAQKRRLDTINAFIRSHTDSLPDGYAITRINAAEGTYTASYSPEERGREVS